MYKISKIELNNFAARMRSNEYEAYSYLYDYLEEQPTAICDECRSLRLLLNSIMSLSMATDNDDIICFQTDSIYRELRDLICGYILQSHNIYPVYSSESDITFIMQDTIASDGSIKAVKIIGFYYGEACQSNTLEYINELEATFDL